MKAAVKHRDKNIPAKERAMTPAMKNIGRIVIIVLVFRLFFSGNISNLFKNIPLGCNNMLFGVCLICFVRYKTKKKRKTVKHSVYGLITTCFMGACRWVLVTLQRVIAILRFYRGFFED